MVWIAIAASKIPTRRDITVEIVRLINLDPQLARYKMIADTAKARNIAVKFSIDESGVVKSPNTMTDVIAPGPASSGTARGLDEMRISSSVAFELPVAARLLRA